MLKMLDNTHVIAMYILKVALDAAEHVIASFILFRWVRYEIQQGEDCVSEEVSPLNERRQVKNEATSQDPLKSFLTSGVALFLLLLIYAWTDITYFDV